LPGRDARLQVMPEEPPHVIVLTGGFGDEVARAVVAPGTPGHAAVVTEFGQGIVGEAGQLDRKALADLVFTDRDSRHRLEAIVHPLVRAQVASRFAKEAPGALCIYEVPLWAESGADMQADAVVVVDAPDETRMARLVSRGMTPADVSQRMGSQAGRAERLEHADYVVDNSGTEADLEAAVIALWRQLKIAK